MTNWITTLSVGVLLAACGGGGNGAPIPVAPSAAVAALQLAQEPAGAIGVLAAKEKGPAAAAVVTGRLASSVQGLAAFTLMDLAIPYCGETNPEDHCKTPWDYCCETAETRTKNSLVVEARDAGGKPLATPGLGLRLLDRVVVTGRLTKDEHGNFTLLATGWYRQQRPELPGDLRWPQ